VITPMFSDQFYWARRRIEPHGASVAARRLSEEFG